MTKEDLIDDGWMPQDCKIGTLYFKENFFARLLDDGKISLFSIYEDMYPFAVVSDKNDFDKAIKGFYYDRISKLENKVKRLKEDFFEKYGESI